MSHTTRKWSGLNPSRFRPASEADDAMREIRQDFGERMDDLLDQVGDWSADPVVAVQTKYMYIHWSRFRPFGPVFGGEAGTSAGDWDGVSGLHANGGRILGNGTMTVFAEIILPVNATLVDVDLSAVTAANTSIAANVYRINQGATGVTGARTALATRTIAASTAQGNYSLSSGANINHTLDSTLHEQYFVELLLTNTNVGSASFAFQGVRVTYTRAALRYA